MNNEHPPANNCAPRWRTARLGIVLAGIILGQFILFWPSLLGQKILLPLDILADPSVYIPISGTNAGIQSQDNYISDLIYSHEPLRRFAVSEIHSGHWPMWMPGQFAGVPFVWVK